MVLLQLKDPLELFMKRRKFNQSKNLFFFFFAKHANKVMGMNDRVPKRDRIFFKENISKNTLLYISSKYLDLQMYLVLVIG